MKKLTNKILENILGIHIINAKNIKEKPTSLVKQNATKLIYFYELMKMIRNLEGDIVECGVGWGRSLFYFSLVSEILGQDKHIYGFDSFQGFPEPTDEDHAKLYGIKKGRYKTQEENVLNYLLNCGINQKTIENKITLIKGFFSDTLSKYSGNKISLLHLDVDLYQSYKETLSFFYPKVVTGGIIAFDEYQSAKFVGAKKAIDEFFSDKNKKINKSKIANRYYIII